MKESLVPKVLALKIDKEQYKNALSYQRFSTVVGLIIGLASLAIEVGFILLGGIKLVYIWALNLLYGSVGTGLLFWSVIIIFYTMYTILISLIKTFIVEQKFGLNTTTIKTFILDSIKGTVISLPITLIFMYIVLYFFEKVDNAWVWVWIIIAILEWCLLFLAPKYIIPLFNKLEPLKDGDLKYSVHRICEEQNFRFSGVYIMDGSKRSRKANAFFTGFGKNKRIVLFDTLVEKCSHHEILAVLAHEIGHYKKRHLVKYLWVSFFLKGLMFSLMNLFLDAKFIYQQLGVEVGYVGVGLFFFMIYYRPISLCIKIVLNIQSRKNEYEADIYSLINYRKGGALAGALLKLSSTNKSHLSPHWLKVVQDYTHPPLATRLQVIEKNENIF